MSERCLVQGAWCLVKRVSVLAFRLLVLAVVTWAFFGGPFCWLAVKAQGLLWGVVATLLLGRFFCRSFCPLGILQSLVSWIFHPKRHVRRVCTRLPETKAQRIVRWSVLAACVALGVSGYMGVASMALPISIYGKAVTLWAPGVAVFALVMTLAAVGKGRVWCNWVCPFGTVFNLVAKISLKKDKIDAGCEHCRKCYGKKVEAVSRPLEKSGNSPFCTSGQETASTLEPAEPSKTASNMSATRRETLKGVAVLAVTEKFVDGGYADVSLPGVPERENDVLPPGAGDRRTFAWKCVGCQLCVANCPGKCLAPSTRLTSFGQPVMDFRHGYCIENCVKCSAVCPERALLPLQREQRPNVHVGCAVWKKDLCVRTTNGDQCTACVRKCPVQAIHLVKGFPVVDREKCIGCGACEHVCPSRPMPAIYVKGYEMQRVVNPISEADLLAEMKAKIAAGESVVVARGGVIVASEKGRGIGPLVKLYDAGKLRDAIVVDKVIGRAAAALCAQGGAKKVFASLAGKGAGELLEARGIPLAAEKTVDVILNHEQSGSCPMEKAVSGIEEPAKMIEAIRKAMRKK